MIKKTVHFKVAHIASGDLWAGAEVQLFTLAKALHSTPDIIVEVILLNHGRLEQELRAIGINVTVIDETQLNSIMILFRLISILREISPDIIHTHRLKENILGSIAARISGNIPGVRTVHGAPEHPPAFHHFPKRFLLFIDWFCGRYLQHQIIAVSDELAEILTQRYPVNKIHVINNGIDVDTLEQTIRSVTSTPKKEDTTFRIGIAGRLVPIKRVDLFIQTAGRLLTEYPDLDVSFHVYGNGPLREELEVLNQQLGTNNRVHFEGHREDIHHDLGQLDLLLMTSDHEGLPMVLLEAMALRTPIIAHAVGGITKLLDHGACGLLVHQQKPDDYMQKILYIINNSDHTADITQRAYLRVKELYSADQNAQSYCKMYTQCIS